MEEFSCSTLASTHARHNPLSLEALLKKQPNCRDSKRTAYFIGRVPDGSIHFGLDGTASARIIEIPQHVYKAIGMPEEGKIVPLARIYEAAGYQ